MNPAVFCSGTTVTARVHRRPRRRPAALPAMVGGLTPALLMYCFSAAVANVAMGISGFGSGIVMVLGWQVANMLRLDGVVPFEGVQVLLVAMALPTATFLTCRSWQSNAIDVPVCLTFGVTNLLFYSGGLLLLLHVLIHTPALLKHALGGLFLVFALLRIASDFKLIPGSGSTETVCCCPLAAPRLPRPAVSERA